MTRSGVPAVGIDLGTTFSVVAHLDADGKPRTIPNEEGDLLTPSVVFFDRANPVVGREAVRAATIEPHRVAHFAKRDVGQTQFHKPICGRTFPPEVIESLVLRKLRNDACLKLGDFSKAVVTVPAYFNEPRRKATQDAGRLAGLEVIDIINEPTAAAIAFGYEQGFVTADGPAARRERVLVYDLGGGTFDATLMDIDGVQFRAVAIAGDVYLGGIDWDERLAQQVAEIFRQQYDVDPQQQPDEWERLLLAACEAKHSLTAREETTIFFASGGRRLKARVTRADFEALTGDLLDRTRLTVKGLLRDAGLKWTDLTRVLLVGGATRMPMVSRMLVEETGLKPDRSLSPDEAVAHGAALYAGLVLRSGRQSLPGMSVRNVNSHALGVMGIDPETKRPRRKVMIPRNTPLPAEETRSFRTLKDGQKAVVVRVVEGGTDSGAHATPIGKCVVTNLPPNVPGGTAVEVTFRYGQDGRLTVQATLPGAGREANLTIERASGMSERDLGEWSERIRGGLPVPDDTAASKSPPVVPRAPDRSAAADSSEAVLPDAAESEGESAGASRSWDDELNDFLTGLSK